MRTLPNGIKIFNATPYTIRFWSPGWDQRVEVEPDTTVEAEIASERVEIFSACAFDHLRNRAELVTPSFLQTKSGRETINSAYQAGADVVVGSIIAAQAYPGSVVAVIPCEGYEHVLFASQRMRPDMFTVY